MDGKKYPACAECQRRKQKCNRQFPCNHCSKREVVHLCRSVLRAPASNKMNQSSPSLCDAPYSASRKRNLDASQDDGLAGAADDHDVDNPAFDASDALNALGYMPHTHHLALGRRNGPKAGRDSAEDIEGGGLSEELRVALKELPAKPHTDCLVDNWLYGANYHYYALYPSEFRTQYDGWWAAPVGTQTPEVTSLILRVCACSALFLPNGGVKSRLEVELKEDVLAFADRMHRAAEDLSRSIQHGKGGLPHVQQLFLTAFWYKSAEKWTEAWYALSAAVRAGFEIGLHQDSSSDGLSEFDRETRRRVCALSSMLSRPMIVNRADCNFEMPTLALEIDPEQPYQPSPFRHMKLHCQLCMDMAKEMAVIPSGEQGQGSLRLRDVVERWFAALPDEYAVKQPATCWDGENDLVGFQRRYLHLIGYMSLFGSLKPYVTRNSAEPMSGLDGELRSAGVKAALDLMDISWKLFETVASTGAKFHYSVFCIFDTTTVLCSAFVQDEARNLPQRETVLEAIKEGLNMLQGLRSVSKTTSGLCRILNGLLSNLPLSPREKSLVGVAKRVRHTTPSPGLPETDSSRIILRKTPKSPFSQEINTSGGHNSVSSSDEAPESLARPGDSQAAQVSGDGRSSSRSPGNTDPSRSPSYEADTSPLVRTTPNMGELQPAEHYSDGSESLVSPVPSNGHPQLNRPPNFIATQGGFGLPSSPEQLGGFQSNSFQPASFDAMEVRGRDWQLSMASSNDMGFFHDPSAAALDPTMPTVLECWDWQGLDLGHPGAWGNPHMPM